MFSRAKVRFATGILICAVLVPGWSQTSWQGSAAVGRSEEFPPDGLYAASSAFPLNSTVDVTNPATGDRARVVIVRETNDPGVFMVISESVADELSMEPGDSTTLSASPVQSPGLTAVSPNEDLPFHPDPDVNPAASFGDPNAALLLPPSIDDPAEAEAVTESTTPAEADSQEELVADGETVPEVSAPEAVVAADPKSEEPAPDETELLIAEADTRRD